MGIRYGCSRKRLGGEFYDLAGPKTDLAFCPLRDIDGESDITWAVGWIEALCQLSGLKVTPRQRNSIADAVHAAAASRQRERSRN